MNPSPSSHPHAESSPFEDLLHEQPPWQPAPAGLRFVNYLIDTVIVYVIRLAVFWLFSSSSIFLGLSALLLSYGTSLAYYWFLESAFGKTVGKMLTRTRVLTMNCELPSSLNILGRTLCRFIPFDALSFLFRFDGWHDSISGTQVVQDR